jgi:tetratricopeptide (TPR) repeat protein
MRYSAFISYSHADKAAAAWLHRAIETYRTPRRVRGRAGPFGPIGATLPPVFRDRDELRAAPDLAHALNDALAEAHTLIVVCSPQAAASRWVNEEIRQFAALGRADRVFCLIVAGGGPGAASYLPPALFDEGRSEPLAADIRKGSGGRRQGLLKLVAAIIGLDYDELRQREVVRRNQQLAVVAAASLAGLVLASGLAVFALISRDEALRQRDIAEQRLVTAERTVDFVKSMFQVSDPSEARGATISAREILDRGAERIQTGLDNEPAVKAELGVTLGEVYLSLGLFGDGDRLIRQTLGIRHGQAAVTVEQLLALGEDEDKQNDEARAIAADQAAIAIAAHSSDVGPALRSRMYEQLAEAQSADGQNDDAERSAATALSIDQARRPQDPSDLARDLEALGNNEAALSKWSLAQPRYGQALALRLRAEGPSSPSVADDYNSLGRAAYTSGDLATAERDYRRVIAIDRKVFDPDHPDDAVAINNVARVMVDRREFADAIPLLGRVVAINAKMRSADNGDMAFVYTSLGLAERGLGRTQQAEQLLQKALAIARRTHHPMLAPILSWQAAMRCEAGDGAAGVALLTEARPIMQGAYPGTPWRTAWIDNVLGECLLRSRDPSAGRRLIEASSPVVLAHWPGDTLYGHEALRRLRSARSVVRPAP